MSTEAYEVGGSEVPVTSSPVESYNEWDPVEEVIVGVIHGASVPEWDRALEATMPKKNRSFFQENAGGGFPDEFVRAAAEELDQFASLLAGLGVTVVRPSYVDYRRPFTTPNWRSPGGLYSAMPRDLLLIVGDLVIEAPMAWRSRYFEVDAYRPLLKGYFERGARWISAPKPQLLDALYDDDFDPSRPYETGRYVTVELEPTFDAADFVRCGRDIFVQRSHVTNQLGIEWVRRVLGDEYRVHMVELADSAPMHIDASFMPLAPGKLLLNRHRVQEIPRMFESWEIRFAPDSVLPDHHLLYMSTSSINMNVFMIDEGRVVVEAEETPLIRMLEGWGLEVVRVPFRNVMRFGGCFHCVTADVRRRGVLQSYFNRDGAVAVRCAPHLRSVRAT